MTLTLEDIEDIQRQIDELKAKLKEDKDIWKLPEYEDGSEYVAGFDGLATLDIYESYTKVGRRRATKELAERCAKASRTRDLLEAYRDHIEPGWRDTSHLSTCLHMEEDRYYIATSPVRRVGTVYGSEKTMRKICDALNAGEITL